MQNKEDMMNNEKKKIKIRRSKRKTALISLGVVFVFTAIMFLLQQNEYFKIYNEAKAFAEQGNYQAAVEKLSTIDEYKDSKTLYENYSNKIKYDQVLEHIKEKDYDSALLLLIELNAAGGYENSFELQKEIQYKRALDLEKNGDLDKAYMAFTEIPIDYLDVTARIDELQNLRKLIGKWLCKQYQIDMEITAHVDDDNISHLAVEIKDRKGFLLGTENKTLKGNDLILNGDRFIWDMFNNGINYRVLCRNSKIDFSKLDSDPDDEKSVIVSFVRRLSFSDIDGDIDGSVKGGVN